MKTVYHPTLPASYEVPEGQAQAWKDQGWRFTPPKAEKSESADDN